MSTTGTYSGQERRALARMVDREEVLQICYWYQGEGFGEIYDPAVLAPFLNTELAAIEAALEELTAQGCLEPVSEPRAGYRFTPRGKKEGGRLFADGFSDYQKAGHGECADGCCDGDDHSQCGDDCTLH